MNKDNIISLVLGLLIASIISGVIYFQLFLETFDLFGIESIVNPEQRHGKIFYTTLSITLANLIAMMVLRARRMKYASLGTILFVVIGSPILIMIGPTHFNKSNYYLQFTTDNWETPEDKIKVARQLVKSRELIGLTMDEVKKKLGQGTEGSVLKQPTIFYELMGNYCKLAMILNRGKVEDACIWVDN